MSEVKSGAFAFEELFAVRKVFHQPLWQAEGLYQKKVNGTILGS